MRENENGRVETFLLLPIAGIFALKAEHMKPAFHSLEECHGILT